MSRILKAYQTRFRSLLGAAGARRIEQGVEWLVEKAERASLRGGIPLANSLTQVYEQLSARPPFQRARSAPAVIRFFCDAGLGGLARWLRAAGYDALWEAGIDDDELLRQAVRHSAVILTTDSMLMERRVLRDGVIPGFWMPPTLTIAGQLRLVFREFALAPRDSRCMSCGGELRRVAKEALQERIPPRTYRWLEEFFVCNRCDKVFWHGTHWERIRSELETWGR
ncbi:MAG TPA: Mut7-C RNAse domain-containing protein [Dongiaceae bacterium]|nr:Mut7-C RNAse domain-containing protein [Dongiaceae bacterium]